MKQNGNVYLYTLYTYSIIYISHVFICIVQTKSHPYRRKFLSRLYGTNEKKQGSDYYWFGCILESVLDRERTQLNNSIPSHRRRRIEFTVGQSPTKPENIVGIANKLPTIGTSDSYCVGNNDIADEHTNSSAPGNSSGFLKTFKLSNLKSIYSFILYIFISLNFYKNYTSGKVKRSVTDHAISQAFGKRIGGFTNLGSSHSNRNVPTTSASMYFGQEVYQNEQTKAGMLTFLHVITEWQ